MPQAIEPTAGRSAATSVTDLCLVVIGRNEGDRLIRCLASLADAGAPVVYVDSASTDDSVAAAAAAGAHVVELDRSKPFTAARARNAGAARARQLLGTVRLFQFLDGDCVMAPGWLETAASVLERDPRTAVVCGRRRERAPERSVFNRMCDLEWDTPVGEAAACGGDALMRADAFHAVGGFDERLTAGEEPELCARLRERGWTIRRIDAEMTLHDADMERLGQWWIRSVRGGYGYAQVWETTRATPGPLYARELKRAAFWAGGVPAAALAGLFVSAPVAVAAMLLPVAQVARLAVRRSPRSRLSWQWAGLTMLSKIPELQGALRYAWGRGQRSRSAIRYK